MVCEIFVKGFQNCKEPEPEKLPTIIISSPKNLLLLIII